MVPNTSIPFAGPGSNGVSLEQSAHHTSMSFQHGDGSTVDVEPQRFNPSIFTAGMSLGSTNMVQQHAQLVLDDGSGIEHGMGDPMAIAGSGDMNLDDPFSDEWSSALCGNEAIWESFRSLQSLGSDGPWPRTPLSGIFPGIS